MDIELQENSLKQTILISIILMETTEYVNKAMRFVTDNHYTITGKSIIGMYSKTILNK